MRDGISEIGTIHRVKMKIGDTLIKKIKHLFCRNRCGHKATRFTILLESVKTSCKPSRNACARFCRELRGL